MLDCVSIGRSSSLPARRLFMRETAFGQTVPQPSSRKGESLSWIYLCIDKVPCPRSVISCRDAHGTTPTGAKSIALQRRYEVSKGGRACVDASRQAAGAQEPVPGRGVENRNLRAA